MKTDIPCLRPCLPQALRRHLRWAVLGLGLSGLLWQSAQAQFALPFYEPFPAAYTNGGSVISVNGVNWVGRAIRDTAAPQGAVWTWGGSGTGNQMVTGGARLSYPGLWQAADTSSAVCGLFMASNHVSGNRNAGVQLVPLNSGKVYASFLVNVQSWPTANRMVCQMNSLSTTIGGTDLIGFCLSTTNSTTGASNQLYVVKHSSAGTVTNAPPEAPVVSAGTTHLVVMRYTFNHASNPSTNMDELAMWIDPTALGVGEGSVPPPATVSTDGIDVTNFSTFAICVQNDSAIAGSGLFLDEIRLGRTWAEVTPTSAPCLTAGVVSSPTNTSVVEGGMATFNVVASGTSPTYQWQVSTDGGATWNAATGPAGFGTTASSMSIPSVSQAQNGAKYRCQVSVGCDSSVAYSAAATLTVTAPVVTAPGPVMDDLFASRDRLSGPVTSSHSVWFTDATASLFESADPDPFMLVGQPQSSACVWLGYFTDSSTPPVHLAVGTALKVSLSFSCQNIVSGTNSGLRLGLFDHYDAGVRLTADGGGAKALPNAAGNRGYAFYQNWDAIFSDSQPQIVYARNNLVDSTVLGTTGNYVTVGRSASGFTGAPAFSSLTPYTLDLVVARVADDQCSVSMNITGGGTNYMTVGADTAYGYHRFDSIAIRPNNVYTTAYEFDISEFKVQVVSLPPTPKLNLAVSGGNLVLSWASSSDYAPFRLTQAATVNGTYTAVAGATSPYTVSPTNTAQFFRLAWP